MDPFCPFCLWLHFWTSVFLMSRDRFVFHGWWCRCFDNGEGPSTQGTFPFFCDFFFFFVRCLCVSGGGVVVSACACACAVCRVRVPAVCSACACTVCVCACFRRVVCEGFVLCWCVFFACVFCGVYLGAYLVCFMLCVSVPGVRVWILYVLCI